MFCTAQVAQLCHEADELAGKGLKVLIVESHEPYRVRATLKSRDLAPEQLPIPLLSDPAQTVAASYGVAFQMNDTIEFANRPALFLIGRDGVVRFAYRAKDFADRYYKVADLLDEQARALPR